MNKLDGFQITNKWPAKNPEIIQLYSLPTPNGVKVSAMLEETYLDYEPHLVSFGTNDQMSPEFLSLNPNNKIPAIIDPNGPNGEPFGLWETGAILLYLAEKTGKFISTDPAERHTTMQWLMWQMGGLGPMFGQYGFFHKFAGKELEDKTAANRYRDESIRLLGVLNQQLANNQFVVGNAYSIADISVWPWIRTMIEMYNGSENVGMADFKNVLAWYEKLAERPALQKATNIPPRN